ncbi:MAG: BT_3928 family protein [Bacteroidia bacterium]
MDFRKIITNAARVFVGLLFIFSGFIKANDPLGFSYKLEEYFAVFGTEIFTPFALSLSMFICVFEIFLGFTLLMGVYRKFTLWMLLLMIVFFTFLTFYSAWFNKVTDCGCFGDAIKLTPWQSFWKDIALLTFILIIFFNQKYLTPIFSRKTGVAISYAGLLASIAFTLYAWYYLPPIDFRPYAIGKDLRKQMEIPPNAEKDSIVMIYVYKNKKSGEDVEFPYDDVMAGKTSDENVWAYVDRKDKKVREGYKAPIHDFAIYKPDGSNITEQFLSETGYRLLVIHYDVQKSYVEAQAKVNGLTMTLLRNNKHKPNKPKIKVWGLSGSSAALVDWYRTTNNVPYTFYQADATVLKTIIRSNPGMVLMKDNVVVEMWPATDVPTDEEIYSYVKK